MRDELRTELKICVYWEYTNTVTDEEVGSYFLSRPDEEAGKELLLLLSKSLLLPVAILRCFHPSSQELDLLVRYWPRY